MIQSMESHSILPKDIVISKERSSANDVPLKNFFLFFLTCHERPVLLLKNRTISCVGGHFLMYFRRVRAAAPFAPY